MLNIIVQAFKNKETRKRIYFTLIAFVVFKIMTFVTVPLVNPGVLEHLLGSQSGGVLGFADALTGGALKNYSIIALGVSPYITASIVIQILQMDIVPVLSEWSKEGEAGKHKIQQVTRYSAIVLAFIQALGMAYGFRQMSGEALLIPEVPTPVMYVYIAIVMTAGTAAILWLADQITNKGIGNGTSMIIMAGIVASFPYMITDLINKYVVGFADQATKLVNKGFKNWTMINDPKQSLIFVLIVFVLVLIIVAIIFMQNASRKIPIQYANRANSATLSGKKDSHLPIKLNPSGVIPVIFAMSLLSLPLTVSSFTENVTLRNTLTMVFDTRQPIGFVLYIVLILTFSFFYAFVQISPEKVADNLRKQGSYIPGVRPGKETENFVSGVLLRTTVVGATYLMLVAILPIIFTVIFPDLPSSVRVGGTSLLIVVGVAQELFKQLESKSKSQKYSGFIK